MDIETLRVVTIIGTLGAVVLYIYRILCAVDLMQSTSPKVEGYNKLVYAGLIFFVPLGIGAWIYDFVVNDKKVSPLFLFPFVIVVLSLLQGMFVIWPHATQFNFDFITW